MGRQHTTQQIQSGVKYHSNASLYGGMASLGILAVGGILSLFTGGFSMVAAASIAAGVYSGAESIKTGNLMLEGQKKGMAGMEGGRMTQLMGIAGVATAGLGGVGQGLGVAARAGTIGATVGRVATGTAAAAGVGMAAYGGYSSAQALRNKQTSTWQDKAGIAMGFLGVAMLGVGAAAGAKAYRSGRPQAPVDPFSDWDRTAADAANGQTEQSIQTNFFSSQEQGRATLEKSIKKFKAFEKEQDFLGDIRAFGFKINQEEIAYKSQRKADIILGRRTAEHYADMNDAFNPGRDKTLPGARTQDFTNNRVFDPHFQEANPVDAREYNMMQISRAFAEDDAILGTGGTDPKMMAWYAEQYNRMATTESDMSRGYNAGIIARDDPRLEAYHLGIYEQGA